MPDLILYTLFFFSVLPQKKRVSYNQWIHTSLRRTTQNPSKPLPWPMGPKGLPGLPRSHQSATGSFFYQARALAGPRACHLWVFPSGKVFQTCSWLSSCSIQFSAETYPGYYKCTSLFNGRSQGRACAGGLCRDQSIQVTFSIT